MNHTLSIEHYRILAELYAHYKNAKLISMSLITPEGEKVDPKTWGRDAADSDTDMPRA